MDNQPKGNNTVLWVIIVVLLLIVVGGGVYWYTTRQNTSTNATTSSPTPTPTVTTSPNGLSEQPDATVYGQYFSAIYLAKLAIGQQVGPNNTQNASSFNFSQDQFCTNLTVKQVIPAGQMATAVYSDTTHTYVQAKTPSPVELKVGGNSGCERESWAAGSYEYKIYVNDVLAAVLPFQVL